MVIGQMRENVYNFMGTQIIFEGTKLITIQDPYTEPAGSQEPARKCKFQMAVYMLKLSRTEMLSTVPCSKFRGASFIFFQFLG